MSCHTALQFTFSVATPSLRGRGDGIEGKAVVCVFFHPYSFSHLVFLLSTSLSLLLSLSLTPCLTLHFLSSIACFRPHFLLLFSLFLSHTSIFSWNPAFCFSIHPFFPPSVLPSLHMRFSTSIFLCLSAEPCLSAFMAPPSLPPTLAVHLQPDRAWRPADQARGRRVKVHMIITWWDLSVSLECK